MDVRVAMVRHARVLIPELRPPMVRVTIPPNPGASTRSPAPWPGCMDMGHMDRTVHTRAVMGRVLGLLDILVEPLRPRSSPAIFSHLPEVDATKGC